MNSKLEANINEVIKLHDEVEELESCAQVLRNHCIDNGLNELYEKIEIDKLIINAIKNYNIDVPSIDIRLIGRASDIIQIKTEKVRLRFKLSVYGSKVFYMLKGLNTNYHLELLSKIDNIDIKRKYLNSLVDAVEKDLIDELYKIINEIKV